MDDVRLDMSADVNSLNPPRLSLQDQITVFWLTLVELGWVLPWYGLLLGAGEQPSRLAALLTLGALMVAAYSTSYWLASLNLVRNVRLAGQGLVLLLGLALSGVVLLGSSPLALLKALLQLDLAAVFTFIVVVWVWWRGAGLTQGSLHPQVAWNRFRLGLLMLLIQIAFVGWTRNAGLELGWFWFFLFSGFMALVFARVVHVAGGGTGNKPFDRRWMAGIVLTLGAVLILAAVFASLLTGQFSLVLELLAQGIRWVTTALLFLAALPGMLLAGLLGTFMEWLRSRLDEAGFQIIEPQEPEVPALFPDAPPEPGPLPQNIQSLVFWVILSLVLIWIFWRLGRRMRRSQLPPLGQPESLLEPGEARELLRKAFQNTIDDLAKRLRPQRRVMPALHVRRIYIELLDFFAEKGLPRPVTQTPLEYLPAMQSRLPEAADELDEITRAYLLVRYGEAPETAEQVDRVDAAWQRVVDAARQAP
jgi:hypothetical protein